MIFVIELETGIKRFDRSKHAWHHNFLVMLIRPALAKQILQNPI